MSSSHDERAHWKELVKAPYGVATATLSLGIALFSFNAFCVATALPSAVIDLGGTALISWSLSLYLIFSIVSGFACSGLAERFGSRSIFFAAAFAFLLGTVLAGAAPDMPTLLAGRALQGIGAGLIQAGCYALIPEIFPGRLLPKIFGVEAAVWALAAFGGPLIAGYLTETLSWRASFLINAPIILLFAALVPFVTEPGKPARSSSQTPIARLLAIAAAILLATTSSVVSGVTAAGMIVAAALGLAVVVRIDRGAATRLFPRGTFGFSTPLGLGFWIVLLMPMAQATTSVYLVFVIQQLWHYPPSTAGALNAVMALSWSGSQLALASLGGGFRPYMIRAGTACLIAGLLGLIMAFQTIDLIALIVAQILIGSAFGLSWGHLSQTMMEAAPLAERNMTASLLPTLLSAGYAIGAAVMGLIGNQAGFADFQTDADLQATMRVVLLSGTTLAAAAFAAAIGMAMLLPKGKPGTS